MVSSFQAISGQFDSGWSLRGSTYMLDGWLEVVVATSPLWYFGLVLVQLIDNSHCYGVINLYVSKYDYN